MNQSIAVALLGTQSTGLSVGVSVPADGGFAGLLAELSGTSGTKRQEQADVLSLLAGLIPAAALQNVQAAAQADDGTAVTDAQALLTNALATGTLDEDTKQALQALLTQLNAQAQGETAPAGAADMADAIRAVLDEIWTAGQDDGQSTDSTTGSASAQPQTTDDLTTAAAADALLQTGDDPAAAVTLPQAGDALAAPVTTGGSKPLRQLQVLVAEAQAQWQAEGKEVPAGLTTLAAAVDGALTQSDEGGAALADGQAAKQQTAATVLPQGTPTTGFLPTLNIATQPTTATETTAAATAQTAEVQSGAEIYDQLVDRIQTMRTDGQDQMIIQLKPESLGRLTIRLTMGESGLVAQLAAANPRVQESLAAQAATLANALSDQGLKDVRVVVTSTAVAEAGIDQQLAGQGRQQQGQSSRRGWAGLESDPLGDTTAALFQAYEEAGRPGTVDKLA